jgi:hypothetical protein
MGFHTSQHLQISRPQMETCNKLSSTQICHARKHALTIRRARAATFSFWGSVDNLCGPQPLHFSISGANICLCWRFVKTSFVQTQFVCPQELGVNRKAFSFVRVFKMLHFSMCGFCIWGCVLLPASIVPKCRIEKMRTNKLEKPSNV